MLERKITSRIREWKRTKNGQGLLITGARQVGKTSAVEAFAQAEYENMIKIDFVEKPDAVSIIGEARDINDLIMRITALASEPLPNGKTLLFFDEVQRCGDAITWMRYLANDKRFDVIYSGSMLGVEAFNFRSFPVGTLDTVEMFPMDFEEFSWAFGVSPAIWNQVRNCFETKQPLPDYLHDKLMHVFDLYVLVGGMPEAVQTYASTKDTQAMRARQSSILAAYRADITRYVASREHAQKIKTIFDAVPAQLNKENRRYIISGIDKSRRFLDLQPDFDWLENAGVVIPVKRVSTPIFPLGMQREDSYFKLYLSDTGLLFSTFGSQDVEAILARREMLNIGLVYENIVAQQLRAAGYDNLYYFNSRKIGEVDFIIETNAGSIVPVEVKSGRYIEKHAALDGVMAEPKYQLDNAIVLSKQNVKETEKITYLPIYMSGLL